MIAETLILTNEGWVELSKLNVGDYVKSPSWDVKVLEKIQSKAKTLVKVNNAVILMPFQNILVNGTKSCFEDRFDMQVKATYRIGCGLTLFTGEVDLIEDIEVIRLDEAEDVLSIVVEGGQFFANGVLVEQWFPVGDPRANTLGTKRYHCIKEYR